jgi:cytidylate kinase
MGDRDIQRIVEKQIATWRTQRQETATPDTEQSTIVISYAAGTSGMEIADRIAERLELPHHDQEIVEYIASSAKVHLATVESLDKHVESRIDELIAGLFRERSFDRSDYLRLLRRTVARLRRKGPCVISGHGAVHLVPRDQALMLRLTAPAEVRAQQLAVEQDLDLPRARRQLHRIDSEQAAFHRRFFDVEVDDPAQYDLIIDTAWLEQRSVVELASQAYQLRFGDQQRREELC